MSLKPGFFALKVFTVPLFILIGCWLIKELSRDILRQDFTQLITEFCWEFWSFTLFYYLIAMAGNIAGFIASFILSIALIFAVDLAYRRATRIVRVNERMFNYYRSARWRIAKIVIFMGAYFLLVTIVVLSEIGMYA